MAGTEIFIWLFLAVALYSTALIYLALKVRALREQSEALEQDRQQAYRQAAELRQQATDLSDELDKQYHAYDEPYQPLYRQASAALEMAEVGAAEVLADQERPTSAELPTCPWWGVYLVVPLLGEYRARRTWLAQTQQVLDRLAVARQKLAEAGPLHEQLLKLGQGKKKEAQDWLEAMERMSAQLVAEVRPARPLASEQTRVQQVIARLREIRTAYLWSENPPQADVVAAHQRMSQLRPEINALEVVVQELVSSRQRAEDSRLAIQQGLAGLEAALEAAEQEAGPVQPLEQDLATYRLRLSRLDKALQAGDYIQVHQEGEELAGQIASWQARLEEMRVSRRKFDLAYQETHQALSGLLAQIEQVPPSYELDVTLPLLIEANERLPEMRRLAHSADLEELHKEQPVDLKPVQAAWQKFSEDRREWEQRYPVVETGVSALLGRVSQVVAGLQNRHQRYLQGVDLPEVSAARDALLQCWETLGEANRVSESDLAARLDKLGELERLRAQLERLAEAAFRKFTSLERDLRQAQEKLADPELPVLVRRVSHIAAEGDEELVSQAEVSLEKLQRLQETLRTPGTDFAELSKEAATLRDKMDQLVAKYPQQLAKAGEQKEKLAARLRDLYSGLRDLPAASEFDLRLELNGPLQEIEKWQARGTSLHKNSLKEIKAYVQEGEILREQAQETSRRVNASVQAFDRARQQALEALAAARLEISNAETAVRNAPWSRPDDPHQKLWPAQDMLSTAEGNLKRITTLRQQYTPVEALKVLQENVLAMAGEAVAHAAGIHRQIEEQLAEVQALRGQLNQAIQRGDQALRGLFDEDIRREWQDLNWEMNNLETHLLASRSYAETRRLLQEALLKANRLLQIIENRIVFHR